MSKKRVSENPTQKRYVYTHVRNEDKAARAMGKKSSPRLRAPHYDADELIEICVKGMEHEKTTILRSNLRNILGKYQHCLHVRHTQKDRVELPVPRHRAQAFI